MKILNILALCACALTLPHGSRACPQPSGVSYESAKRPKRTIGMGVWRSPKCYSWSDYVVTSLSQQFGYSAHVSIRIAQTPATNEDGPSIQFPRSAVRSQLEPVDNICITYPSDDARFRYRGSAVDLQSKRSIQLDWGMGRPLIPVESASSKDGLESTSSKDRRFARSMVSTG